MDQDVFRQLCVKTALICKNDVKVRVRLGLGLGSGLGLGLAFHRCTDKGHIFTDKGLTDVDVAATNRIVEVSLKECCFESTA